MTSSHDASPELAPYFFSTNAPLPPYLQPALDAYLHCVATTVHQLDQETRRLASVLEAKKKSQRFYKNIQQMSSSLSGPIPRVPTEIVGLIFGFVFGDKAFDLEQYRTHGRLRRVCSRWNGAALTTPGLCKGLVVDLCQWLDRVPAEEKDDLVLGFKKLIAPWIAIIHCTGTYHLQVKESKHPEKHLNELYLSSHANIFKYLLVDAATTPTSLCVSTHNDVLETLLECKLSCLTIGNLSIEGGHTGPDDFRPYKMALTFPKLEHLVTKSWSFYFEDTSTLR